MRHRLTRFYNLLCLTALIIAVSGLLITDWHCRTGL